MRIETVKSPPFLTAYFRKQQLSEFTSEIFVDGTKGVENGAVFEFSTFAEMMDYFCGHRADDVVDEALEKDLLTEDEADVVKEDLASFANFLSALNLYEIDMIACGDTDRSALGTDLFKKEDESEIVASPSSPAL